MLVTLLVALLALLLVAFIGGRLGVDPTLVFAVGALVVLIVVLTR